MKTLNALAVLILLLAFNPNEANAQNSIRALRKLANSKDPDKLRKGILEFSQKAKNKSNYKQSILFSMLLGDLYQRTANYPLAEKYLVEAYDLAKQHLPRKKEKFALAYFSSFQKTIFDPFDRLAYFYVETGNLRKAQAIFEESKTNRDNFFPFRSIHRAHPIAGMGSVAFHRGDINKTYEFFNEARKIVARSMTTNYDYDNVNRLFLNDLVEICLMLDKREEANKYISELALASSGTGKFSSKVSSRIEVARIFELRARYYLLERNFERSQFYLDRADYYNPTKVASSDIRFKLMKTRALLEWAQNHTDRATTAFQNLVTAYRRHIADNFVVMSEYEKEQFYYSLKKDFDLFNAFVMDQQNSPSGLYEEMFNNVLNTKALLLSASNQLKNNILKKGDSALLAKFQLWEYSKTRLSAQYYEKTDPAKIDALERRIDELEKDINKGSGLFEDKENAPTWQQVKGALGQKDAAVEILRIRLADKTKRDLTALSDSVVYAVLLLTPSSTAPEMFVVSNGNQLEKHFLPYYRNAILSRLDDRLSYDQFWTPMKRHLGGMEKLFVSPDGVYNQINLNTLQNTVSHRYLIDEMKIVYLTKTSDLLQKKDSVQDSTAVLVGRPSYDFEGKAEDESKEVSVYGIRNVISEELESFKDQDFADLPGTETEIGTIEPILIRHQLTVSTFKGEEALEENVKAVQHPAILHIATHGFFVDDQASTVSPMIRSGIVLAGVKNNEKVAGREDGILTAYEATNLDLQGTNLVVLSACQTGLGEVRNGEGVYGLQRAIVVAGANNLLMSLWKVDDIATADLMASFYQLWSGNNNTDDFRNAQIKLRQKYPQPFFWGAFVMLGN